MNKSNELNNTKDKRHIEDEKMYETLHRTIGNWPDWGKKEYNTNLAVKE